MYYELLPIEKIELDKDNPRIKQWIEMYGDNVTSEGISLALQATSSDKASSSYTALKESIKNNGGIINPIIVNKTVDNKYIVIEGNTRLQIYKEFKEKDSSGIWDNIMCLIYEDMSIEKIHAIRLQAHLVGPRDWDPYSKAKYLYQLSEIDKLPLAYIESYCGNKKSEIRTYIDAYKDMIFSYKTICEKEGMEVDPRDFSKFAELQKSNIKQALYMKGFNVSDFSKWVINRNIDNAQNVRLLPKILKDKDAFSEFLKSNITEAKKLLDISSRTEKILENIPMYELMDVITKRLRRIEHSEVKSLRDDPRYEQKRESIIELNVEMIDLLEDINIDNE